MRAIAEREFATRTTENPTPERHAQSCALRLDDGAAHVQLYRVNGPDGRWALGITLWTSESHAYTVELRDPARPTDVARGTGRSERAAYAHAAHNYRHLTGIDLR